jgi:cell division protein FtsA
LNFRINNKIIDDPLGQKCEKLGILSFNVYSSYNLFEIINKCFKNQKIKIKSFFDSGIASSEATLTKSEKNQGVACIDIGAKTSKISVFVEDKIVYTKVVPIGGEHVTNDIAKGLEIKREFAEHSKIIYGTLSLPFNEKIEINSENFNNKTISKNLLYGIIKPRYEEIFEIIRDHIFDDIYARVSIKSIVITGGASKIYGLTDISESIFNRKVRLGCRGNKESFFHNKPEFSTILGLIKLAQKNNEYNNVNELTKNNLFTAFDKLENWIEESYA